MTDTARDAELKRKMDLPPEAGKWYYEIRDSWRKSGSFDSEADAVDAGHLFAVALHCTGTFAVGQWEASVRAGKPTKWISLREEATP